MKTIILSILSSFFASLLLMLILLPLLRKLKAGQYILSYVKEHKAKNGTPTMGGLGIIGGFVLICLCFYGFADRDIIFTLSIVVSFTVVGFLDDFLKIYKKTNEGLKPYQKIIFQLIISLIVGFYAYFNNYFYLRIPFSDITINVRWGIIPISAFILIATVNCVNLTDGLDGLAGNTCLANLFMLGIMTFAVSNKYSLMCFISCGAISAFLLFNTNKASIFMGDTGSLALGSIIACTSLFSQFALFIPILGIMFVVTGISVISQVIYYKRTGKRIFLMSPVHHHFQMLGFSESKISYAYSTITLIAGLVVLIFM